MAQSEEGPKNKSQDKIAEVEILRNQIRALESEISLLRKKPFNKSLKKKTVFFKIIVGS